MTTFNYNARVTTSNEIHAIEYEVRLKREAKAKRQAEIKRIIAKCKG